MIHPDMVSAVAHLRRGGLLIYPTETSYALGCDATNAKAVREIFRVKRRERGKSLPLIVASRAMAERYARLTPLARRLVKKCWPGPLTIIVDSPPLAEGEREGVTRGARERSTERWGRDLASGVVAHDGSIALRVSAHPIARALTRVLNHPIVSTSANHSGQPPCYSVRSALRSLNFFLPLFQRGSERGWRIAVLDAGPLPRRPPSTIVDIRGNHVAVLRQGSVRVH